MDPPKNTLKAKALSERSKLNNLRRMKVGAQVTAVITLLEALGNFICANIWIAIRKAIGTESLILGILLYFVLLSYAFLMNTTHNRNRVVEEGWYNVFKNVFGVCNKTPVLPTSNAVASTAQDNNSKDGARKAPLQSANIYASTRATHDEDPIFTISRKVYLASPINDDIEISNLNVPENEQACSSNRGVEIPDDNVSNDSDDLPGEKYYMFIRFRMIAKMLSNIENERIYINHLKHFISFEEAIKKGEDVSQVLRETYDSEDSESNRMFMLEFLGDFVDRIKMRKEMLLCLLENLKNDIHMYDESLEIFINMGEDMVG